MTSQVGVDFFIDMMTNHEEIKAVFRQVIIMTTMMIRLEEMMMLVKISINQDDEGARSRDCRQ